MTSTPKSILDRLKEHWFISTLLVCVAVATATWNAATAVLVAPRDFQIAQLREEIQRLRANSGVSSDPTKTSVTTETLSISEGSAFTTSDGRLSIHVDKVTPPFITVSVTLDANAPRGFRDNFVGSRLVIEGNDRIYFVDLLRTRAKSVDLAVSFRSK